LKIKKIQRKNVLARNRDLPATTKERRWGRQNRHSRSTPGQNANQREARNGQTPGEQTHRGGAKWEQKFRRPWTGLLSRKSLPNDKETRVQGKNGRKNRQGRRRDGRPSCLHQNQKVDAREEWETTDVKQGAKPEECHGPWSGRRRKLALSVGTWGGKA